MMNVGNRMIPLHTGELMEDGLWCGESEALGVFVDRHEWAAKCEAHPGKFALYDYHDPNTIYDKNPVVLEARALIYIPCQAALTELDAERKQVYDTVFTAPMNLSAAWYAGTDTGGAQA